MLVLLSDTHGEADARLTEAVHETVTSASLVAHAGDFTTASVLDAFETQARELVAVSGNSDTQAVTERLPAVRTFEFGGRTFVLTHGHRHDGTALSLLARQEGADVVVVGHTHVAGVDRIGDVAVVNPGSHADPRGGQATVAVLTRVEDGLQLRFVTGGGMTRERVLL